jgi:serpin B
MFGYASAADWQALELRYDGGEIAMLIVLPAAGKLVAVENAFSAAQLKAIVAQLTPTNIHVTLPKWQLDWSAPLGKVLQDMGMTAAFSPAQADLSGIGGSKGELYITAVLQKTFIGVDERGTEAAAATAVIVGTTSAPPPPIDFTADRPFIYVIRDVATEAVLFVGRVGDPSAGI